MSELPNERKLERQLIAGVLFEPSLLPRLKGLEIKHFLDKEARDTYKRILEFSRAGQPFSVDDFTDSPLLREDFNAAVVQPSGTITRILEAYELRQAAIKHGEILKAAHSGDIEKLRSLTGAIDVPANLHPWSPSRRTIADALEERPPREYVVKGLLKVPGLSVFYGRPGGLKTQFTVSMAAAVAAGQKWLTQLPSSVDDLGFETIKSPVLFIDFDSGRDDMDEKIEAAARGMNLMESDPLIYYSMPMPRLNCREESSVHLIEMIIRAEGAKLVIIDNLGLISGAADENSGDMITVMGNLRWLADSSGASIVVIHHSRKQTGIKSRRGELLRGHSSIEGSIDLGLEVAREDGSDMINLTASKVRGAPIRPFSALFTFEHKQGSDDMESCRFWGMPASDDDSDQAIIDVIHEILDSDPLNKGELIVAVQDEILDCARNRARRIIDQLVSENKIHMEKGSRGAKKYSKKRP